MASSPLGSLAHFGDLGFHFLFEPSFFLFQLCTKNLDFFESAGSPERGFLLDLELRNLGAAAAADIGDLGLLLVGELTSSKSPRARSFSIASSTADFGASSSDMNPMIY